MEQSPSQEANRSSTSWDIPHILRNPKAHHHILKFPCPAPILSEISPFHAPQSHFLKIHFSIILSHLHGLPSGLFLSSLPTKMLYAPLLSSIYATCLVYLILLDLWTEYLVKSTDHGDPCVVSSTPITSTLLNPSTFLRTTMCLVQSKELL
jgi:hypothetical protein